LSTFYRDNIGHKRLQELNKYELIQFIVEKGNERKRDQCEATTILTQDAQDRVSPIVEAIRQRIQYKREKVEAINK
jgi:hypothetical protein